MQNSTVLSSTVAVSWSGPAAEWLHVAYYSETTLQWSSIYSNFFTPVIVKHVEKNLNTTFI